MGTLADNIRDLRKQSHMTQNQLAEEADINRVTLAKYEAGTAIPGAKVLARLADVLGVNIDVLMGNGSDDMTEEEKEIWELREAMRRDPERRALMKLAKNGTEKDVRQAMALIDALRATNPNFYDGDDPA